VHEIVLPDNVKPALEWVNNRVLAKVTPRPKHGLTQAAFASELRNWARSRGNGIVGTELHFQVQPPGEISRTLVPDVAYASYDRVSFEDLQRNDVPRVAPDVVVEVRSPDDTQTDIDEKVRVYLSAGTRVIFLVDPDNEVVEIVDTDGRRTLYEGSIRHPTLPGFMLPLSTLFELPRPLDRR
jgi:Uma2 family endonuclease